MYFVVGDIHGCYKEMKKMLKFWDKEKQKLIFLGDLIDRGKGSKECLLLAKELVDKYGAIVLSGNHEDSFIKWLGMVGEEEYYYLNDFDETIHSFFPEIPNILEKYNKKYIADKIRNEHQEILNFIMNRPVFYETERMIFAHAGVNNKDNWKENAEIDCRWIRKEFIYGNNKTGKKVIFGHTLTRLIRTDKTDEIWVSDCGNKIGIDGGCVFKGQLNAIVIDRNGTIISKYKVKNVL